MPYSHDLPPPADAPTQEQPTEDWAHALPGLDLMHDLRFQAPGFDALAGVVDAANNAGARIDALRAETGAGGVVMRCRVKGISSEAARRLIATLEARGWAAGCAQVEHVMIARGSSVR